MELSKVSVECNCHFRWGNRRAMTRQHWCYGAPSLVVRGWGALRVVGTLCESPMVPCEVGFRPRFGLVLETGSSLKCEIFALFQ